MGQSIEVKSVRMGNVVLFDTNRSVTGQEGESYASVAEAGAHSTVAARMAARVLQSDASIDHVHLLSNLVSIRGSGWSDDSIEAAAAVIRDFFVHYAENRGGSAGDLG